MSDVHTLRLSAPAARRVPIWLVAPVAWGAIVVAGHVVGARLESRDPLVHVGAPPLVGTFDIRAGASLIPAVALAVAALVWGPMLARRLRWPALLATTWAAAAGWAVTLGASGGWGAITRPLQTRYEYLAAVGRVHAPHRFLSGYVDALVTYPTHVKGHPPGMVLLLWVLERAGLGGATVAAALVIVAGALVAPAALVTVRSLADEAGARRAAPFLAFAPAAVWVATSADALFAGVGAVGIATFALATVSHRRRSQAGGLAAASGLVLGAGLMLTYGLATLCLLVVAIAAHRRAWQPLLVCAAAAAAVFAAFAAAGFWWPDGLHATREFYCSGIAARRPYGDFLVIDLAAVALAAGPAVVVALGRRASPGVRVLTLGAVGALGAAALSGMSRGEVERIWLPFVPWLLAGTAALSWRSGHTRGWFAAQLVLGLALQAGVKSPW